MTKEKVANQEVEEQNGLHDGEGNPSCEGEQCANMAEEDAAADTMADENEESEAEESYQEPSPEEVIAVWRDKYMRLQAEFDN